MTRAKSERLVMNPTIKNPQHLVIPKPVATIPPMNRRKKPTVAGVSNNRTKRDAMGKSVVVTARIIIHFTKPQTRCSQLLS
jgi:hypothetical protein